MNVYILLSANKTNIGTMIRSVTGEPYSHVSIAFSRNLKDLFSFSNRRGTYSDGTPLIGGLVEEDLSDDIFKESTCALYTAHVSQNELTKMKRKLNKFIKNKKDLRYSTLGLFSVLLNKEWERRRHFFCSQFVAEILKSSGKRLSSSKPPSLTTPMDIVKNENFELVYEGPLNKLNKQVLKESVFYFEEDFL